MSIRTVRNEFAKMRRLRLLPIAAVMVFVVVALALYTAASSPGLDLRAPEAWNSLLAGMSLGIPLVCPLLLAVLASRLTDVEHHGGTWLLQATAGLRTGRVCRAKMTALGIVTTLVTVATSALVLLAGRMLVGISAPVPLGAWAGFTVCVLVVDLVVLALHVLISAHVENQLVALGIGVMGCVIALFSQGLPPIAQHLTPWGHYALAQAADYRGEGYVALTPS